MLLPLFAELAVILPAATISILMIGPLGESAFLSMACRLCGDEVSVSSKLVSYHSQCNDWQEWHPIAHYCVDI